MTFQHIFYCFTKGARLHCERAPFTMQKTSNRALKGMLLQINEIKLTDTLPAIRVIET